MKFLFFAYRDWAINIFKRCQNSNDEFMLITNKNLCNTNFIGKIKPDKIFFYGWSWIVPSKIINEYSCFCLHPSRLPEYRGGSPIQNQIMNNEKNSAVTIFKMTDKLDVGQIYFQQDFDLSGYLSDIFNKIESLGVEGTLNIINEKYDIIDQDESKATFYKRKKPEESEIKLEDFNKYDAEYFYNKVRALQYPYPETYIRCKEGRIILEKIRFEK